MATIGQDTQILGLQDRRGIRVEVTLRAYGLSPVVATLRDASSTGAMIRADTPTLGIGDEVVLTAGKLEIVATIAWRKRAYFGVAFHRRLEARELAGLRGGSTD